MSFVTAVVAIGTGIYSIVQGQSAAEDAKSAADDAREEMNRQKAEFKKLDTSNPYLDMENTMEDLTINQRQAEFEKQTQMQQQANILDKNRQAAGTSGIAALAQSLANEGALSAQKSSATIGTQEAANQKLAAEQAGKIQGLEREGDLKSRQMQADKVGALMGMAAGDVSSAQEMQASAQQQISSGVGSIASGAGAIGGELVGGAGAPDFGSMTQEQFQQWLDSQNTD
jgi:hypothetical protein